MKNQGTIDDVRNFWENSPLWSGESKFVPGSKEFFDEHRSVVIGDCMAGEFDERYLPRPEKRRRVLDLGCGPGFWTVELAKRGCSQIVAADLTQKALDLTRDRIAIYGVKAELSLQNAEKMTFRSGEFSHVNCQGVIHHTPNTEACVREIHRVLEPQGTASISVYFRNLVLRSWPLLKWPVRLTANLSPKLSGRGREAIALTDDTDEIVRLYDGKNNPIGKAFSEREFKDLLRPYFDVQELFLHFFPARTFSLRIPRKAHQWLDRHCGFMIAASLRKKN